MLSQPAIDPVNVNIISQHTAKEAGRRALAYETR